MHIVTASDENYVAGVFVLLSSAARHNPGVRFSVLTTNWSHTSLSKLEALRERLKIRVDVVEIAGEALSRLPVLRAHLTASAYARLFIPDLLPDEERVIYMDCDMLVTGSLDEAWTCDLNDKVVAAVRCPAPTAAFAAAINLPIEQYFNSGFLVLNLRLWREESIAATCLNALTSPGCPYLSEDESALNDVARGRVRYLDAGFNLYALDQVWQSPLLAPSSIRVIHYVTRPKPWTGPCPFAELWLAEVASLPELSGFQPTPEAWRARLTRWNRSRKALMGSMVGKARYSGHRKAHRFIHNVLIPTYLATGHFPELSGF